jgi:hypothetical protein
MMAICRRKGRQTLKSILQLAILFIFQAGCGFPGSSLFYVDVEESAEVSSIKTVGVWRGRTGEPFADSRRAMTLAFEDAFRANGFSVIEHHELSKIGRLYVPRGGEIILWNLSVPPEVLEKFRDEAGVDALLLTSISNAGCEGDVLRSRFEGCLIACSFRLIDTRSGMDIMKGNLKEEEASLRVAAKRIAERAVRELKKEREKGRG